MIRLDADKLVKENRLRCCFVLTTISRYFSVLRLEKLPESRKVIHPHSLYPINENIN